MSGGSRVGASTGAPESILDRLIDVVGGHEPFANESGPVEAAQNGEICSHAALRGQFEARGHVPKRGCDTEVLPHLFEEHGPALAQRLRRVFTEAVWTVTLVAAC